MSRRSLDAALARGMLTAAAFAALAGVARVAQDAAIAWRHGTGPTVDAYYFVLNLANWPVAVALSTLTLLVAPAEAALRLHDPAGGERWRGELLGRLLLLAALTLPLAWWGLQHVVHSGLSGLDAGATAVATTGIPLLVAAVPLGLLGALLSAWLVSAGRHVLSLLEALPPLLLTLLLLTLPGPVLFWGTAAGVAVQVVAMAWVLRAADALPRPHLRTLDRAAEHRAAFARGAWVLLAGQVLFTLFPLIDPFFAAREGEGVVAALSYANRLVLGLQGLAGLALQRAGLPLLSQLMSTAPAEARRITLRWALAAGAAGALIAALVALLADPLVALVFERGRFGAADRAQVAELLRYGMLQLPIYAAGTVIVTALASARGGAALAIAAVAGLAVKLLLSAVLVKLMGVAGLLVATALMYIVTSTIAWLGLRRRLTPPGPVAP